MSRNLDMAIAEALGYEVARLARDTGYMIHRSGGGGARFLPRYREKGSDMLELEREMRERGWRLELWYADAENVYVAHYDKPGSDFTAEGKAETEALARALAAYYALTGKEWAE